jgi:phage terminase large subunit GpA-like protein
MSDLSQGILSRLKEPDRRAISDWAEENLLLPESKRSRSFSKETAPWLTPVLDSIKENTFTSLLKTTQGGGTVVEQAALTYWVAEAPADAALVAQTDDDTQTLFKAKFLPTLKASPATAPLMARLPRHALKKDELILPSMRVGVHGPGEKSTQSLSLERVLIDETWLLHLVSKAALRNMIERGTASPATFRMVCVSQAGEELADKRGQPLPSEWKDHWEGGTQETHGFTCPACGEWFVPESKCFKAPDDAKGEDEKWIWAKVAQGTRLITPCCNHEIADTEENRRSLATKGSYRAFNPNPLPNHRSFQFSCWTIYWQSWGTNLIQLLKAIEARRRGDIQPLKEWTMKKEAKFWTLKDEEIPSFAERKYWGYKQADLVSGSVPEDVVRRIMTVDVQTASYKTLIRDFFAGGGSRLAYQGTLPSWTEVYQTQARYRVKPLHVGVDAQNWTQEVYRQCAARQWIALHGSDSKTWRHKDGTSRGYSPARVARIATAKGTQQKGKAYFYEWSNLYFKDWLSRLVAGEGLRWEYPDDSEDEYIISLDSERRKSGADGKPKWEAIGKRPNHFWDCENMALVMASIIGIFAPEEVDRETESEPEKP